MKMKTMLLAIMMLVSASATAQACGCCIIRDPTGTPLNVRDRPNGAIVTTLSKGAIIETPDEIKKDSRGRLWALIDTSSSMDGRDEANYPQSRGGRKGWVFYKYLKCG